VLKSEPNNIDVLFDTGTILQHLNRNHEAQTYYDKVLELDSNDRGALLHKGVLNYDWGNYWDAIYYYDKILEIDSNDQFALNNKANALKMLDKDEEALSYLDKALEIDPNYPDAIKNKQLLLEKIGNLEVGNVDQCANIDRQCYQKYGFSNSDAINQCISVRVYNCQLDRQIAMLTWALVITPIVIVGIVGGILIKKHKNKTGNITISEKSHIEKTKGKTEKEVDDKWGGI